jgi:Leucine-rich repeat (LRR) protein
MCYSRRTTFLCVAALTLFAACKKNDSGTAVPATGPEGPATIPAGDPGGSEATEPEETVDLTDYLIRATIRLPKGTKIEPVSVVIPVEPLDLPPLKTGPSEQSMVRAIRNKGAEQRTVYWTFTRSPRFDFEIAQTTRPLSDVKAAMQSRVVNWVKEEPNLLIAEVRRANGTSFEFEARVQLGSETYQIRDASGQYSKGDVERMARAATSLAELPNAREAVAAEQKARSRLNEVGCEVTDVVWGRRLVLTGDRVTDADLAGVKDIAGVTELVLGDAPKLTPKGVEALAGCRRVWELRLSGPTVTDPLAAPLAKLAQVQRVYLEDTAISDLGLQFLAGYRDLVDVSISRTKSTGVTLNGSGFSALKGAQNFELLVVRGQPLSDECVEHLAKIKTLRHLVLIDTKITDKGIQLLERHPTLAEVSISQCPIRGGCLSYLADLPALTGLTLNGVAITDTQLDRLKGSKLSDLGLQNMSVTDRALAAVAEIPDLIHLDLTGTRVTDAGLAHLGRLERLANVSLARTDVTGTGLTHFKARPALRSLDLTDTLVTDAALGELSACPNLKTLRLGHTGITDAGLARLADLKALSEITLTGSEVTRAGVEKFKAAKPTAKVEWVEPANLADPKPVAPPVAVDKLPPADGAAMVQKYGGRLRYEDDDKTKPVIGVSLAGSAVTDADLGHLRGWKLLQFLDLSDCKNVTDAGLAYLARLPELTELNLAGSGVRGDGLDHLKTADRLRALDARKTGATARHLAPLAALKNLERLTLDPVADERVLRFLAGLPNLKEIDLRGFPLTNRRLGLLQKMTGLERLEIQSNDITDRGLLTLKGLRNMKDLRLDSDSVSDAGLQAFAGMVGLKSLELSGRRITDTGFQHFRECKELERIKVERTGLSDRALGGFKEFGKLIELELRHANITDQGLVNLADLNQLELIDLTGCPVTDDGLKHFKGLEELRKMVLEGTRITGRGFKAIEKLPRLARVQMVRCPVTDLGLEGVARLETLEQLNLDDTPVNDEALGYLRVLPALKSLSLVRATRLTDKAADILKACPALADVNLRGSGVSATAVAELKKKNGLTVLAD